MPKALNESTRLVELDTPAGAAANRKNIQIITPGWGSSGYYSPDVLERAAKNRVIPAGTQMFLNHASESERTDRPERDVEKIAAVLVEDAIWDGTRLCAPADLIGPHAELIESLAPYIGVSISGSATDITVGEAEGRTGPIIEDLAHVTSVDFVTHAGRGGMVLLESARPSLVNARAVGHGVTEATVNDTRDALSNLLRDTYGADKTYVWVRDFDDTTVWFEVEADSNGGLFSQAYSSDAAGVVALTGDRAEVRVVTTYVPVRPGGSNTTTESEEDTMPEIKIDEAEHSRLVAEAGRVTALEERATTAERERDEVRTQLAERDRRDRASVLVDERATTAEVSFTALERRGLLADLPVKEGALDEEAFTRTVDEAAAAKKTAGGAGTVSGFGGQPPAGDTPSLEEALAALDASADRTFGPTLQEA